MIRLDQIDLGGKGKGTVHTDIEKTLVTEESFSSLEFSG